MSDIRYPLHRPELRDLLIRGDAALGKAMGPPILCRKGEVLINTGGESKISRCVRSG